MLEYNGIISTLFWSEKRMEIIFKLAERPKDNSELKELLGLNSTSELVKPNKELEKAGLIKENKITNKN